jgi:CBS domain-containing protein
VKAESVMTSPVITLQPSMSVKEAGRVLVGNAISAAPVLDSDARLVGMLTESDILALQTADDPRNQVSRDDHADGYVPETVAEIMSTDVLAVSPDTDSGEIARLVFDQHLRCVPVVAADTVVGVVSRRDLLRTLVRPDDDTRADLDSRLGKEAETYGGWSVAVTDGVVSLTGPADLSHRRLARIVAHTVPGVLGVRFRPRADVDR